MVLATSNREHRLLFVNYVERVTEVELADARSELQTLLADLPPDFRLLADLSRLDSMEAECVTELGRTMELISQHGVGLILRVIPDASKDIGLNILTIFHYPRRPRVINCQNLAQAIQKLALWK